MWRLLSIWLICFSALSAFGAEPEEMERLASEISEEIRSNLLAVETKVAYVGKDGARAYLTGYLSTVRPGHDVVFYRDGAAIMAADSVPMVLGRESVQVGRGKVSAVHDRTAWVQIDTGARHDVERGDWALVQLEPPALHVIPFFVDEGGGAPKMDGRGRILRSLILYHLKRRGLKVVDAELLPAEVDAAGLPIPSALSQYDTDGVLLIGRLLPRSSASDELVVGIALFDLALREMRLARSYQVRTLAAFAPPGSRERVQPLQMEASPAQIKEAVSSPPPAVKESADPLKNVCRAYLSTTLRMEWPPKTPADLAVAELVSLTLPDVATEWIEDTPGYFRIKLHPGLSANPEMAVTAKEMVELLSILSRKSSAVALIGASSWKVLSESELSLALDSPLSDIKNRLAAPDFRLLNDRFEPVGNGFGPYRIASKGARTTILEKSPASQSLFGWTGAPDTLTLIVERDPKKRAKGFEEEQVDLYEVLDEEFLKYGPATHARIQQNQPEELVSISFNLSKSPGSDVHFRRMAAMVLDRRTVLDVSLNQRGLPAEGILPPAAKDVAQVLVKLPEKSMPAAQVLAKTRTDTGRIVLIFPVEEPHYGLIAEGIRSDLAALNIQVEPQGLSWRVYTDRLTSATDYDMALVTLAPSSPYRLWVQRHFSSNGRDNLWNYRNGIVDTLLLESGDLGAALDLIQSDLPVIPLFWLSRRIVLGPRVSEAWPSAFPQKFFSSIRLK